MKSIYKKQLALAFVPKACALILSLFTVRVLLNNLGVENYGLWSVASNILTVAPYLTLGIAASFVNYVLVAGNKGKKKIAILFTNAVFFMALIAVVTTIFALLVNTSLKVSKLDNYFIIAIGVSILLSMYLCILSGIYQGNNKSHVPEYSSFFISIFFILGINLLKLKNIYEVLIFYNFVIFINLLIFGKSIFKDYFIVKIKALRFNLIKKLIIDSGGLFFAQIFGYILYSSDRVIILYFLGAENVTNYDLVMKIFSPLLLLSAFLLTPSWAYFSSIDKNKLKRFFIAFEVIFFSTFIVGIILINFLPDLIHLLFDYKLVDINFIVYAFIAIAIQIHTQPYCYFLNAKRRLWIQAWINGGAAILNVALASLWAEKFGISGIILATIISTIPFLIFSVFSMLSFKEEIVK